MLPSKTVRIAAPLAAQCRISLCVRYNASTAKGGKKSGKPKESTSFAMNLFRGRAVLSN
ncbi:unnamed protein product, partial [Anisakis simplex]|uniref:Secreted protein n=1 Tax=Anisakis simplex TaxID=6269 RepID=A0A0M3JI70_ANISI